MSKHTPGSWSWEFDEHYGYDCMTCGILVGNAMLDGARYGQKRCQEISTESKAQMEADARLIAAAPELLEALEDLVSSMHAINRPDVVLYLAPEIRFARTAISKAKGESCHG